MDTVTEETDNNGMLDTIMFIETAIAEINKELHSSVSERSEGLDEKLKVVISYMKNILPYSEKLGNIGDSKHQRFVVPLLPKVLPTCLLDSFSYCNDAQGLLNESDIERYADTLMELFTVSIDVFQFYCQSIQSYIVEDTCQAVDGSAELLDSFGRLGIVLTELDLTSGVKAWNMLLSIFQAKRNSWFQDWRPITSWRYIMTTVEKLLKHTFNESAFGDRDGNVSELSMQINGIKAIVKVFVLLENMSMKPFTYEEISLVISLVTLLQRYSIPMLRMKNAPEKLLHQYERKVMVAIPCLLEPLEKNRDVVQAIRDSVAQCLESGEMFASLLTSSFLLKPQYSQFVEEKSELLEAILQLMDACTSEMMAGGYIPGVQLPGQPLPLLPIYEVIMTKTQAFTTTLLPEEVEDVVKVLLKFVPQPGWSGFAASDTLIFMARYGTESFCFELFQLFEQTISDVSCLSVPLSIKNQRLVALTRRLAFMLSPSDTSKIASSPYGPINQWDEDSVEVILASLLIVEEWTVARLEKLVSSCEKIVWNPGLSLTPFCEKVAVRLCEVLEKFSVVYHLIQKDQGTCYLIKLVLSSALQAISTLDPSMINEEIHHQVWKSCNEVVHLNCSDLDISVLSFMERWLCPDVKESKHKQRIFGLYSETFQSLFRRYYQTQSLILAKLLSVFCSFAEVSQQESVLQCCIPEDAHAVVSEFLTFNEKDFDVKKHAENMKDVNLEYAPVLLEFQGDLEEVAQIPIKMRSLFEDQEQKTREGRSDTVDVPFTPQNYSSDVRSIVSQIEKVANKLAQAIGREKVLEETDRIKLRNSISLLNSIL